MDEAQGKRIIALDLGDSRIGVAASDQAHLTARPLTVLRRKNRDADIQAIGELASGQEAGLIVVGLPRHNGEIGPRAEKAISFGRRLARRLGLPVCWVDEENTTVEAEELLLQADASRRRRREVVDMLAAAIILRRYLDGWREDDL